MLYFQIRLSPVDGFGKTAEGPEVVAHVMSDLTDIDIGAAAAHVVKRLHGDGWRIVHVIEARPLLKKERFFTEPELATVLREAEEKGFAYVAVDPVSSTGRREDAPTSPERSVHSAAESFVERRFA